MNTEPTVEDCLKELREMFPREEWLEARESRRYANGRAGSFGEAVVGYEIFRGATLNDCMAQVRAWKEAQHLTTVLPDGRG